MKSAPLAFLRECFDYDPALGRLAWRERPRSHFRTERGWRCFNTRWAGREAGSASAASGYVIINLGGASMFAAHRVCVALILGAWPDAHVDHVNGDRRDNRLANLRLATRSDNQCNRSRQLNNRSGIKGVHRHADGRWRAQITKAGVKHDLGLFDHPQDANAAYERAASALHGEFARTV